MWSALDQIIWFGLLYIYLLSSYFGVMFFWKDALEKQVLMSERKLGQMCSFGSAGEDVLQLQLLWCRLGDFGGCQDRVVKERINNQAYSSIHQEALLFGVHSVHTKECVWILDAQSHHCTTEQNWVGTVNWSRSIMHNTLHATNQSLTDYGAGCSWHLIFKFILIYLTYVLQRLSNCW